MVGKLINSSNYLREFYEENLCYLLPCYEIEYHPSARLTDNWFRRRPIAGSGVHVASKTGHFRGVFQ